MRSGPALARILVPIDFSKGSLKALDYAVPMAEPFQAYIHLLHVLEPLVANGAHSGERSRDEGALGAAKRRLVTLAQQHVDPVVPVNPRVRQGKPSAEIVAAARDLNIDLIVLATHGYTGLKHVLLGSTAEQVVRHAPCPVLVVRECERDVIEQQEPA